MIKVAGNWVLITGGSSGIGLSLAKLFARQGANVAILARRKELLDLSVVEIKKQAKSADQVVIAYQCDVSNEQSIRSVMSEFENSYGSPLILVNSAGISYPGEFHEISYETIKEQMDVNYLGTAYTIRAAILGMIQQGRGYIVNISSMAGVIGTYGYSAYGASKYAVRGLSDVLRSEYKLKGIKVFVVFPPDTDTPQLAFEKDLKPEITAQLAENSGLMQPDEVANIIWKDMNRGRYTIIPGFNSWFLYRLSSLLGDMTYFVMDLMVQSAIISIQKRKK